MTECGACGHDRDDHADDVDAPCGVPGCGCQTFVRGVGRMNGPITLTTDEARLVASVLRYYAPTADYWNEDGPACRALAKRLEEAAS